MKILPILKEALIANLKKSVQIDFQIIGTNHSNDRQNRNGYSEIPTKNVLDTVYLALDQIVDKILINKTIYRTNIGIQKSDKSVSIIAIFEYDNDTPKIIIKTIHNKPDFKFFDVKYIFIV